MNRGRAAIRRIWTFVPWIMIAALSILAVICLSNDFVRHITPDISVYLLHARTFVQELNRFTASHDSKGILLTFILALPVRLFGADMFAVGLVQLFFFAAAFLCCFAVIRTYAGKTAAVIISLLGLCAIHSHHVWEANGRPEDFALAFVFIALLAMLRGGRLSLAVAGAITALCFFLKVSLAFTPAMIILIALLYDAGSRIDSTAGKKIASFVSSLRKEVIWVIAGFVAVGILIFGWIFLFDNIHGWYRQTIQWPLENRVTPTAPWDILRGGYRLIVDAKLLPLFLAGWIGLIAGWTHGHRREALLLAGAVTAEWYRTSVEGAYWNYLATIIIPLLLISVGLLGAAIGKTRRSALVWITPLLFLAPFISDLSETEGKAFEVRYIERLPSPAESFAELLRPHYQDGETILPINNDYQMVLLMNAPRPAPILPCHYRDVSAREQLASRFYYEISPPDWVIEPSTTSTIPPPRIIGGVDYAYHVQLPAQGTEPSVETRITPMKSGRSLFPMLPSSTMYRLEVDNGYLRAWRAVR